MRGTTDSPDPNTPDTQPLEPHHTIAPHPRRLTLHDQHFAGRYLNIGELRLLPLTIEAKPLFDHYVQAQLFMVSDLSFANNFIWLTRMSAFYQVIDDCFCLFSLNGERLTMLLPPIGPEAQRETALGHCFAAMASYNGGMQECSVEYVQREYAATLEGNPRWQLMPTFPDYIYRTADLIELRGNSYKNKRNEVNLFLRNHPQVRLEPLDPALHSEAIRGLLHAWLLARLQHLSGEALSDFLTSTELERQGIERALRHFAALGLSGLALFIDDTLQGFTFGERLNPQVASILVEKTNLAIGGCAQYLFREFCRHFADCEYINVGDDLGLENMRRVKMSYRPVLLAERYTLQSA